MKIEIYNRKNKHWCEGCSTTPEYVIELRDSVSLFFCKSCFDELKSLEKPKNKVKKWQWLFFDEEEDRYDTTKSFYTDEEAEAENNRPHINGIRYYKLLRKIPESEIEVEE